MRALDTKTAKEIGSKGGKASKKAQNEAKLKRESMTMTEVMEDLLKENDYKRKVCKSFLEGDFSAKSMEVLLKMLNTGAEKPTSLEDFLNDIDNES